MASITVEKPGEQQMPKSDSFDGAIVQGTGDLFGDKVYYVSNGRRHWIPDAEWFNHTPARGGQKNLISAVRLDASLDMWG